MRRARQFVRHRNGSSTDARRRASPERMTCVKWMRCVKSDRQQVPMVGSLQQMVQRFADGGAGALEANRPADPIKEGSDDFHFVISQKETRCDAMWPRSPVRPRRRDADAPLRYAGWRTQGRGRANNSDVGRGFSDWRARSFVPLCGRPDQEDPAECEGLTSSTAGTRSLRAAWRRLPGRSWRSACNSPTDISTLPASSLRTDRPE